MNETTKNKAMEQNDVIDTTGKVVASEDKVSFLRKLGRGIKRNAKPIVTFVGGFVAGTVATLVFKKNGSGMEMEPEVETVDTTETVDIDTFEP